MPIEVRCANPGCGRRERMSSRVVGRRIKCQACGETFVANDSATLKPPQSGEVAKPTPGGTASSGTVPLPGAPESIGRFVIRGKLGAGAFGTVYRAYDPHLDREVALKVPNPGVMADARRAERFLREAKAAANLRHPHVVPVFDAGKDGDMYYIASAFIDGKPLSDDIPESGTDFARAARLARELAEALAYAHEQGVVHRDVKPHNMMLDKHDQLHLMDFGLASRQDDASKLTNDGAVVGTPAYMAPEQAAGKTDEVGPASDQYAAGVVLYELLAGQVPFAGPLAVVIHNAVHTAVDSPRKRRADVSKDLETICLKALAKRPGDRYSNCQALADDLRRWLEAEPIAARRLSLVERGARWVRREPKLAAAVAAVAAVLLASVVAVSDAARRANGARQQADAARQEAEDALARAERDAGEARTAREREERASGEALGARGTAAEERKKAVAIRDALAGEQAKAKELRAAFESEQHGVLAARAALEGERAKLGELRAALADEQQKIKALEALKDLDSRSLTTVKAGTGNSSSVSLSADASQLATGRFDGTVQLWDAKTGAEGLTLKGHTGPVYCVAFSADRSRVVAGAGRGSARVWDAKTGAEVLSLKGHTGVVRVATFCADDTRLVTGGDDLTARVWDAKTGAKIAVLDGHTGYVVSASFSTNGARAVTASMDGTARVWDAKTGARLLTLKGHMGGASCAAFSADGTRVVTGGDKAVRVWDAKTGQELLTLSGHLERVTCAAFSPDGGRIVAGSTDRTVRVWDAKTGLELLVLRVDTSYAKCVSFSEDGEQLLTVNNDATVRAWAAPP